MYSVFVEVKSSSKVCHKSNICSALVCGIVPWEVFMLLSSASFLHISSVQNQVLHEHFSEGSQPDWVMECKLCPTTYII